MLEVGQRLSIQPMSEADLAEVQAIEREIFATPWPRSAYLRELASTQTARYIVLRQETEIVGYGGLWKLQDEAHVTTIGVRRDLQHRGFGRVLFCALVELGYQLNAKWMTLEVRPSNVNAQLMYESFGFKVIGRRRGYYTDNGEDALVMWSDSMFSNRFRSAHQENLSRIPYRVEGLRRPGPQS